MFCLFFLLFDFYSSSISVPFLRFFVSISFANPHETSLVHMGIQGFKGLVADTKCNRDFYDSGLGFRVLFFVLLDDEQKLGVGVFVSIIFDTILCPFLRSFRFV